MMLLSNGESNGKIIQDGKTGEAGADGKED